MAAFDLLTTAGPLMKRRYDDRSVLNTAFKNRPLFAWIPKKTGITGGSPATPGYGGYQVPITIDDIPGESATFSDAVTARAGNTHRVWQMGRIKRYATATIDWETVRAMKDDVGAFMRAIDPQIQSGINQLSNSIQTHLYGDATGQRGQIVTGWTPADVVELSVASAHLARTWSIGRTVVAAAAASGGALRAGTAKVVGIDIAAGTITLDDYTNITALAADDFLFPLGDHAASGETLKCSDGMGNWGPDPTTITGGDDHKGVDRSIYKEKLLMLHYDASTGDIDANVRLAAAELQANEAKPDALFLHPTQWAALETILASQSRYEMMMGTDASTGFDSIVINAGGGKVNVVSDPWCDPNKGYMLQRDTWELFSIDRVPGFVSEDGNRLHRLEQADQVEFRLGGYYNLACRAPGYNMVLNFT